MADNTRVIVGCSTGEDNRDAVAVSYLTAGAALDQGREVVLWLTSDGVRLGLQGYADGLERRPERWCPPRQRPREWRTYPTHTSARLVHVAPLERVLREQAQ